VSGPGTRRALGALAVAVAAWVALGAGVRATHGARTTADEPQYLLSAISLAEDFDLDISDELAARRWEAFHAPAELPRQTKPLPGGRAVSPHDPLLPLLLAPAVALGGWLGAKLALAAVAGCLAALVAWVAIRRFGVPAGPAVVGAGVFVGAPPLAVYGTQVYPELPAALVVTAAVAVLTGPPHRRQAWALAGLVGALAWLSVKYVPAAAALAGVGAVGLARRGERAALRDLALLMGVVAVTFAVGHRLLYGGWTPYATGDHFTAGEASVMGLHPDYLGRSRRLVGLLVDRDFGLVPWAPAYLLVAPALGALARRRPPGWAALALPLVAGWLVATFAALTMHGWWWPGRQVVVVLPCAVLAVLWWVGCVARRRTLVVATAAGAAGVVAFGWLAVEGLAGRITWVVDFTATTEPLYRLLRPLLPDGRSTAATDLARQWAWAATLTLSALTACRGFWHQDRARFRPNPGARTARDAPAGPGDGQRRAIRPGSGRAGPGR
jgi:hypothetical protein